MTPKHRLDALTGLRFLAALAVAFSHLPQLHGDTTIAPTPRRIMAEGAAGVPFFFVLSGFVLAYSYHDRFARPGRRELGRYALARFARIWPVYLLTVGVAAVWPMVPLPPGAWAAAKNLLLVHMWLPSTNPDPGFNPVAWSLSEEVFFYAVLPVLLWAAAKAPRVGRWGLVGGAAAAWVVPAGLVLWHCTNLNRWTLYVCHLCPLVRLGEFGVGLVLGLGFVRSAAPTLGPPDRRTRRVWTGLELAAVLVVALSVFHSFRVPLLFRLNGYYTLPFALVVATFARQRGALSGLLAGRVAVYLGEVSFAFFLLHGFVFTYIGWWFGPEPVGSVVWAGGVVAAALLVAVFIYQFFETPLRIWVVGTGRSRVAPDRPSPGSLARVFGRLRPGRRAGTGA
ncbi:MAG: putative acyltransferase [Gemmataceae bacterium]|nr:putative acyltransferase [Gemmataceae bacterium]